MRLEEQHDLDGSVRLAGEQEENTTPGEWITPQVAGICLIMTVPSEPPEHIRSLLSRGLGYQYVVYGDSCSGIPGAPHERSLPLSMRS
jgi:hypothetical protein